MEKEKTAYFCFVLGAIAVIVDENIFDSELQLKRFYHVLKTEDVHKKMFERYGVTDENIFSEELQKAFEVLKTAPR